MRLKENLYRRTKAKSSELGISFTRFLEETLEERLERFSSERPEKSELPVSSNKGEIFGQ